MKQVIELRYGNSAQSAEIPDETLLGYIRPQITSLRLKPEEIIREALDGCEQFLRTFRPGDRVVVITSDISRYTGSEVYLPLLVDSLNRQGIPDANIHIIIALGIHRRQTETEHKKILGPLWGRIEVSDHLCDDVDQLISVGRTSSGIDVVINRTVAEADKVILTGTIGFHYFAGFGGGRKAILPGVASRASCMASHFAVLNPEEGTGKNAAATTGKLQGNPVHQAMAEACSLVQPAFILNTILAPDKRIIAAFGGDWQEAHLKGCELYSRQFSYSIKQKADLVVVSCGGFPKDINFIQAHKSMEYASHALKDGGVMILLAHCRDGYGNSSFLDWFQYQDLVAFESALRKQYEINGQTAYSTLQKSQRFKIFLVSELPPDEVRFMGMTPTNSLEWALKRAAVKLPPVSTTYVIPEGGTVLPVFEGLDPLNRGAA